ncbi:MAG: hypothetical protein H7Z11_15930 [Verrucomicrobia bacterium]|nr:hypothetical protein [Leptolyngbya sp. ES-bin-22]
MPPSLQTFAVDGQRLGFIEPPLKTDKSAALAQVRAHGRQPPALSCFLLWLAAARRLPWR